jgi:hypothetical protein
MLEERQEPNVDDHRDQAVIDVVVGICCEMGPTPGCKISQVGVGETTQAWLGLEARGPTECLLSVRKEELVAN